MPDHLDLLPLRVGPSRLPLDRRWFDSIGLSTNAALLFNRHSKARSRFQNAAANAVSTGKAHTQPPRGIEQAMGVSEVPVLAPSRDWQGRGDGASPAARQRPIGEELSLGPCPPGKEWSEVGEDRYEIRRQIHGVSSPRMMASSVTINRDCSPREFADPNGQSPVMRITQFSFRANLRIAWSSSD